MTAGWPSAAAPTTGATTLIELTRTEVSRRAPYALAVVPVGACEQHGPHLPLGTDLMVAEYVARAAAESAAGDPDVIVAPSVPVGYSPYHRPMGATLTARLDTLLVQLRELAAGLAGCGFRRIFLLNGHGGNAELIVVAARAAAEELQVRVGAGSYWAMAWDDLVSAGAQERGRLPGHAGAFETSLVLAMRPDLVVDPPVRPAGFRPNPAGYFGPFHTEDPDAWAGTDGFSDDPSGATEQDGRRYLDRIVAAVLTRLREFAG